MRSAALFFTFCALVCLGARPTLSAPRGGTAYLQIHCNAYGCAIFLSVPRTSERDRIALLRGMIGSVDGDFEPRENDYTCVVFEPKHGPGDAFITISLEAVRARLAEMRGELSIVTKSDDVSIRLDPDPASVAPRETAGWHTISWPRIPSMLTVEYGPSARSKSLAIAAMILTILAPALFLGWRARATFRGPSNPEGLARLSLAYLRCLLLVALVWPFIVRQPAAEWLFSDSSPWKDLCMLMLLPAAGIVFRCIPKRHRVFDMRRRSYILFLKYLLGIVIPLCAVLGGLRLGYAGIPLILLAAASPFVLNSLLERMSKSRPLAHHITGGTVLESVRALAASRGVEVKNVLLYERDFMPLAMAMVTKTGVHLSRPLLEILTPVELEAVLRHEMAHLQNGDVTKRLLALVGIGLATAALVSIVPAMSLFTLATVLYFALCRNQEFECDRLAVDEAPSVAADLARALVKIGHFNHVPLSLSPWDNLVSTHPSTSARIARLAQECGMTVQDLTSSAATSKQVLTAGTGH